MAGSFFDEQEDESRIKAEIVANYFVAWANVMASHSPRIGYFDFFAGPGRYEDGQKSTPLMVLERALQSEKLRDRLVAIFNDADPEYAGTLEEEIQSLEGIEHLKHGLQVINTEVDDDLVEQFESVKMIPALSFVDPWGYKGLSQRLIGAVLKDWGCEVIFFFNYNRINMGITNPFVALHMEALFGKEGLEALREAVVGCPPDRREVLIKQSLREGLVQLGASNLLTFTFRREDGRVSHYLCFVTKHFLGYDIMKGIMAKCGATDQEGIPLYEYAPSTAGQQLKLLERDYSLASLGNDLCARFSGKRLTVGEIYKVHSVDTPYLKKNFKEALMRLENEGKVDCDPPADKRPKNTLADWVPVTFP